MSKERLEEIKDYTGYPYNDNLEEWIVWLIEQAEQNEELAVAHNNAIKEIVVLKNKIKALIEKYEV